MELNQHLVQASYFHGSCTCPHCGDVLQLNPYDYCVKYCGRGCNYSIRKPGSDTTELEEKDD